MNEFIVAVNIARLAFSLLSVVLFVDDSKPCMPCSSE